MSIAMRCDPVALAEAVCWLVGATSMILVVRQPHVRQWIQVCVSELMQKHGAKVAAAGIAGLVGDRSPWEALKEGKLRFRTIYLRDLCFDDLADNQPNPIFSPISYCHYFHSI